MWPTFWRNCLACSVSPIDSWMTTNCLTHHRWSLCRRDLSPTIYVNFSSTETQPALHWLTTELKIAVYITSYQLPDFGWCDFYLILSSFSIWFIFLEMDSSATAIVVLLRRTALCIFCKFLEALNVGLVEWKWCLCIVWYQSCEITIFIRRWPGAYAHRCNLA